MSREEVAELAAEMFEKQERVRLLGMSNTPIDYAERKRAAIEYGLALYDAEEAARKLRDAVKEKS